MHYRGLLQCDSQGDSETNEVVSSIIVNALRVYLMGIDSAIVWGSSAKHSRGQKVGLEHGLEDEDGKVSSAMTRLL